MNEKELQRISQQAARSGVDVGTAAEAFRQAAEMSMPTGEPVNNSPSAEQRHNFPEKAQLSREGTTSDTISRQAAIDVVNSIDNLDAKARGGIVINLMGLPSAEPERKKMSNKEWVDFLSEQFTVSRTSAREMLHALMTIKRHDNFKRAFDPLPESYREEGEADG